jgi:hypothetical protein
VTDDAYHRLCAYTLSLGDPEFVHQHVVDAHAAQTASAESKPIGVAFALVGLYLHLERGLTGREVQQAHMKLARSGPPWPAFPLPLEDERGAMTAGDVLAVPEGQLRAAAIDEWCRSVWGAWSGGPGVEAGVQAGVDVRDTAIRFLRERGVIP